MEAEKEVLANPKSLCGNRQAANNGTCLGSWVGSPPGSPIAQPGLERRGSSPRAWVPRLLAHGTRLVCQLICKGAVPAQQQAGGTAGLAVVRPTGRGHGAVQQHSARH